MGERVAKMIGKTRRDLGYDCACIDADLSIALSFEFKEILRYPDTNDTSFRGKSRLALSRALGNCRA